MLWKKESNDRNAMYIDLFNGDPSVNMQYMLTEMSRIEHRWMGSYNKNNAMAEKYRQIGNERFEKKQFFDAMECYNESLCFAKIGSKAVGLAYANRSTCFLKMKMFKKCLADIELAMLNQYPAENWQKLENRKMNCLKLMEIEDDRSDSNEAELDFEPNAQFSCLANVLTIQNNDAFGHRIVATADIDVDKKVMAEQCYLGVTKYDHYKSCNICLKENKNFIPCQRCTSALFCSDCEDNMDLHGIECNMNFGCPADFKFMDVVRSISLAKNAFTNADELIAFVEDLLKSDTIHPLHLVDPQSKYRAFFQMCPDWRTYQLCLQQAYLFYQLLIEQNEIKTFFRTNAHRRFLMHLVQHHISMILRGAFNKRIIPIGGVNITDTYVNIVAKHIRHSCIPNVCHVFENGFIKCIVIRPIKKGEQLFISYISWDDFASEAARRAVLKERYVNCKCVRCQLYCLPSNAQIRSDLNFQIIKTKFKIQTYYKKLYDRTQVDAMKGKCFDFLRKYGQYEKCSIEMIHMIDVVCSLLCENKNN